MNSDGPTLILMALAAELAPLARHISLSRDRTVTPTAWSGVYRGGRIIAAATGVGPKCSAAAARRLIDRCAPSRVLITGTAGATDPELRPGNVFVPARVVDDSTGRQFTPTWTAPNTGMLFTVAFIAADAAKKAELRARGASAVDMESAAIAAACNDRGVPWLCFRVILDGAGETLPADLASLTRPDGGTHLARAIAYLLRHPWRLGLLLRLNRATRAGMAAVAEHLMPMLPVVTPGDVAAGGSPGMLDPNAEGRR